MIRQPFGHVGGNVWRGDGLGAGLKKLWNFGYTDTSTSLVVSLQEYQQQYKDFMIKLIDILPNTNATSTATGCVIRIDMSTDGGSTFKTGATDYSHQMIGGASGTAFASGTSAASGIPIVPLSSAAGLVGFNDQSFNGMFWINNSGNTTERTQIRWQGGYHANGDLPIVLTGYAAANVSEDTTHIRFSFSTGGTYDTGFIELWGIDDRYN